MYACFLLTVSLMKLATLFSISLLVAKSSLCLNDTVYQKTLVATLSSNFE